MSDDEVEVEFEIEEFQIGPYRLRVHTIAFLPIEILLKNQSLGTEISGQKLWCGSLGVAQYLYGNGELLQGKTVLELGAGTGVLGMLCSRIGCEKVILSDYDMKSLEHMSQDCTLNDVKADVINLDWYNFDIDSTDLGIDGELLIVAGDVLYKKALIAPFFKVVTQFFTKYSGRVSMILCHVPRADNKHEDIISAIHAHQLAVTVVDPVEWKKGFCVELAPADDYERAAVYQISSTHS